MPVPGNFLVLKEALVMQFLERGVRGGRGAVTSGGESIGSPEAGWRVQCWYLLQV